MEVVPLAKQRLIFVFNNSPKKINNDLGNGARKVANSRAIIDVKAELLETMNVEWIRSNSAHLLNEEVHLCFPGNRLLLPNTLTLNVGEFYLHYSSSSNAAIYIDVVPKIFQGLPKTKIPLICLELYIDYEAYTTRVIGDENFGSLLGKRNRLDSNASMGPPSQIRRSSYAMVSKFALPKRSGPFIQRSAVSLKKITCDIDENGGPSFTEQDQVLNGYIRDECIGKGTMKVVYDLELITAEVKTLAYVAKRFFCLDDKGSAVSVAANLDEVQAEMTRLAWASSFLAEFYNYCKSVPGASVHETLFFPSDTFLAREITSPSQASGITSLSDGEAMTWIVEPKRALSVMKFSGTLDHHPQRRDRCAQTVYAFAHFAWGQSNNCLVFADIQGTPACHNGKDSLALFEIMTHTVTGDSGVGDSGEEGIQSFLQDHKCLDICKQLGLDATIPLLLPRSKGKGREQVADTDPESEESQDDDL
ncbi:hypothetical protein EYR36_006059 [Pleurotus pulmonarius]|nr:hypothetical protein EYR36_006059 [Pleurotus pulmonarius]KAF4600765.1 hypothetical protein EYR38_005410 [Pleurotus pulmonarius]